MSSRLRCQKLIRAPSCSTRGLLLCELIFPKFDEVMFVDGAAKVTRLKALKASACTTSPTRGPKFL